MSIFMYMNKSNNVPTVFVIELDIYHKFMLYEHDFLKFKNQKFSAQIQWALKAKKKVLMIKKIITNLTQQP